MGYYLAGAALSAGAFGIGLRVGRRRRAVAFLFACLTLGLLVFKAVLQYRPALEAQLFPWPDYIYFRSYWFYPLALFYLGVAIPMLRRRSPRRAMRAFAAFVFAASLVTESWMILPVDDSSTAQADPQHHCRQTRADTGAAAACVSLLSHWGVEATEGEMSRLCHLRGPDAGLFHVYRGLALKLRGSELGARVVALKLDELRARGLPAILLVGSGRARRAVAVAFEEGRVLVNDPTRPGAVSWSVEKLAGLYEGTAVIVEATP